MKASSFEAHNAVIESFFATLKKECIHRYTFDTRNQAKAAIEAFIFFYNYFRINLKTELTPMKFGLRGSLRGACMVAWLLGCLVAWLLGINCNKSC